MNNELIEITNHKTRFSKALVASLDCDNHGAFIMTIHPEKLCLLAYAFNEWREIEAQLLELSSLVRVESCTKNLILGYASEIQILRGGANTRGVNRLREYF
ncbi:MAG: hypothetical protein COC19_02435 [SAR86 cluster bacterium]|uniref:Uncharacterized protein n=1 Tax=SAR86 cluster bacterium TaxID=2030880 RepID=A0A2A4MS51_9GAMM|nr:MAG: hypothetical protein COC19_02435 [SAR86 cluster bacterium]